MFADLSLENRALKDVIEKNSEASGQTGTGQLRGPDFFSQRQTGLQSTVAEQDGLSLSPRYDA